MNLGAFLSYVFVTTYTPGPNNIMAMRNGNRLGFLGSLPFLLGIVTGFFVIMLASSFFNFVLSQSIDSFLPAMRWIGALYMLYLAFLSISHNGKKKGKEKRDNTSFLSGMLLQFVNVKVLLYGLTVTANFVIPNIRSWQGLLSYAAFLSIISFSSVSCWTLFGAFLDKWMGKHRKLFNAAMALLLMYSAAAILEFF